MIKKVFIICSLCLLMGVGFTFMWQAAEEPEKTEKPDREAGKGYGSVTEQQAKKETADNTESEKYFLVLEDETLCAYVIKGSDKELLKCEDFSSHLIENSEVSKLKEGIYASGYEELCLYMESYIS